MRQEEQIKEYGYNCGPDFCDACASTITCKHSEYYNKEKIDSFKGKYYFLSNFYNYPITYNGVTFKNAESAFQAQKNTSYIEEFINLEPNIAKRKGRHISLRKDWEEVKEHIMYEIVKTKFSDSKLKAKLLSTNGRYLEEGNNWNDKIWGVCNGEGENRLGHILMIVRRELNCKY